jgi:hypothetical protein
MCWTMYSPQFAEVRRLIRKATFVSSLLLCVLIPTSCSTSNNSPADTPEVRAKIRKLIPQINEDYDLLHTEHTPAVHELAEIGLPSLQHGVLELLLSDDQGTRYRAQTVLHDITAVRYGFTFGQGWRSEEQRLACYDLRARMGSCDYKAPKAERIASYKQWANWVAKEVRAKKGSGHTHKGVTH